MTRATVQQLRPEHPFLVAGERVQVVDRPGGLLHILRADDHAKLACGRPSRGTRDHGTRPIEWLFSDEHRVSPIVCHPCFDAVERSLRVYRDERSQ